MKKSVKITLIVVSSVMLAVGLALAIFTMYVQSFNNNPKTVYDVSQKQDDGVITVMNFNVRYLAAEDVGEKSWFKRAERIVKQIAQVQPDIICFQEVTHFHEDYFKNALKGYERVITYRNSGVFAESTPIFYNTNKFTGEGADGFWLSKTPNKKSKDWGAAAYRVCSSVALTEKATGKKFVVFNTHLDHKSEQARINGIQVVLDKIEEYGNLPSMLLGDMNSFPDSETYKKAAASFDNCRVVAHETEEDRSTWHGYGKVEEHAAIDYCFVSPNKFDVQSYHVLAEKVDVQFCSDHYALVIKLTVA